MKVIVNFTGTMEYDLDLDDDEDEEELLDYAKEETESALRGLINIKDIDVDDAEAT